MHSSHAKLLLNKSPAIKLKTILDQHWRIFPYLSELQTLPGEYVPFLLHFHVIVDALQVLSLALLPYHNWGRSTKGLLQVLHATHLPLYDYFHFGYLACFIIAMIITAAHLIQFIYMAIRCLNMKDFVAGTSALESLPFRVKRVFVYLISGPLFLPITQNLLALIVVHTFTSHGAQVSGLFWFSDRLSQEALVVTGMVFGIIGLIVHIVTTYMMNTLCLENSVESSHPLRRCNAYADTIYLGYRLVSCILFQSLYPRGNMTAFTTWMILSSFAMAIFYIVTLPFYAQWMNRCRITVLCLATLYSILSRITYTPYVKQSFRRQNSNGDLILILVSLPIFAGLIFRFVTLLRVSPVYRHAFANLARGDLSNPVVHLPKNLPREVENVEQVAITLDRIENTLLSESDEHGSEEDDDFSEEIAAQVLLFSYEEIEQNKALQDIANRRFVLSRFVAPYLDAILLETDVEVANRFIVYFRDLIGVHCSGYQLRYAATIFLKAAVRYPRSAYVRLTYALFLYHQVHNCHLALDILHETRPLDPAPWISFQIWRLEAAVSDSLNLGQNNRVAACNQAKKAHREAMHATTDFWQMLTRKDISYASLAGANHALMKAQKESRRRYEQLLADEMSDLEVVCCYAAFCDHVLDDDNMAKQCVQFIQQWVDVRERKKYRGAKLRASLSASITQLKLAIATAAKEEKQYSLTSNIAFLRPIALIMTVLTIVLLIVALVIGIVMNRYLNDDIRCIFYTTNLRALVAKIAVATKELQIGIAAQATLTDTQILLESYKKDFLSQYNALLFGSGNRATAQVRDYLRDRAVRRVNTNVVLHFWGYLGLAMAALQDVISRPRNAPHLPWIANDFLLEAGDGFSGLITRFDDQLRADFRLMVYIMLTMLCCVIGLQCVNMLIIFYGIYRVKGTQAIIFALLRLIPLREIRAISKRSLRMHLNLEAFFSQPTREKIDHLLRTITASEKMYQKAEKAGASSSSTTKARANRWTAAPRVSSFIRGKRGSARKHKSSGWRHSASASEISTSQRLSGAKYASFRNPPPSLRTADNPLALRESRPAGNSSWRASGTTRPQPGQSQLSASSPLQPAQNSALANRLNLLSGVGTTAELIEVQPIMDVASTSGGEQAMMQSGATGKPHRSGVNEENEEDHDVASGSDSMSDILSSMSDSSGSDGGSANEVEEAGEAGAEQGNEGRPDSAEEFLFDLAVDVAEARRSARTTAAARRQKERDDFELETTVSAHSYLLFREQNTRSATMKPWSLALVGLSVASMVAVVVLSVLAAQSQTASDDFYQGKFTQYTQNHNAKTKTGFSLINIAYFLAGATSHNFNDMVELRGRDAWGVLRAAMQPSMINPTVAATVFRLQQIVDALNEVEDIVMRLMCATRIDSCKTRRADYEQTFIATTTWGPEETLGIVKLASSMDSYETRFNVLQGSAVDTSKTPDEQMDMARKILASNLFSNFVEHLFDSFNNLDEPVWDANKKVVMRLTVGSIIAAAVGIAVTLLHLYTIRRNRNAPAGWYVTPLTALLLAATLVISCVALHRSGDREIETYFTKYIAFSQKWTSSLFYSFWYPTMYIISHDMIWNYKLYELRRDINFDSLLDEVQLLGKHAATEEEVRDLHTLSMLTLIATALTYAATKNDAAVVPYAYFFDDSYLNDVTWDFRSEPNYLMTLAQYGTVDKRFYSNREADMALSDADKLELAVDTIVSIREEDTITTTFGYLIIVEDYMKAHVAAESARLYAQRTLYLANVILAAIATILTIVAFCWTFVVNTVRMATFATEEDDRHGILSRQANATATSTTPGAPATGGAGGAGRRAMNDSFSSFRQSAASSGTRARSAPGSASSRLVEGNVVSVAGANASPMRAEMSGNASLGSSAYVSKPGEQSLSGLHESVSVAAQSQLSQSQIHQQQQQQQQQEQQQERGADGNSSIVQNDLYGTRSLQSMLKHAMPFAVYTAVLLLSCVALALIPLFTNDTQKQVKILEKAGEREWALANEMYHVRIIQSNRSNYALHTRLLQTLYQNHTVMINELYFGNIANGEPECRFVHQDRAQDDWLFSRNNFYSESNFRYSRDGVSMMSGKKNKLLRSAESDEAKNDRRVDKSLKPNPLTDSDASYDTRFFCSLNDATTKMTMLSRGVGLLFDVEWVTYLRQASMTNEITFNNTASAMDELYLPLLNGLAQSTDIHYHYVRRQQQNHFIILTLLCAFMLFFTVLSTYFVLFPFLNYLVLEVVQTRQLLRTIPPAIHAKYPAFTEYFNNSTAHIDNEERVRRMMTDMIHSAIVVFDAKGVIVRFNEAAEELFGYGAAEVVSRDISMLVPEDTTTSLSNAEYVVARQPYFVHKIQARHKNGKVFNCSLRLTPLHLPSSDHHVFIATFEAIGDIRKLTLTEYINQASVEMNTDGVILIDSGLLMTRINNAAAAIFGYEVAEMQDKKLTMLFAPEAAAHYDDFFGYYTTANFTERTNFCSIITGLRADGTTFALRVSMVEVTRPSCPVRFLVFLEDASTERELDDAEDMLQSLMNSCPVANLMCDVEDGAITQLSRPAMELFQRSPDELNEASHNSLTAAGASASTSTAVFTTHHHQRRTNGLTLSQLLPSRYGNPATLVAMLDTMPISGITVRAARKDGTFFTAVLTAIRVDSDLRRRLEGRHGSQLILFVRDITRLLEVEQAGSLTNAILQSNTYPVVLTNRGGQIVYCNAAAVRCFGYGEAAEMIGKDCAILSHEYAMQAQRPATRAGHEEPAAASSTVTKDDATDKETNATANAEMTSWGGAGNWLVDSVRLWGTTHLGTQRRVLGHRKDGTAFPLELEVTEIPPVRHSVERNMVLFMRDITEDEGIATRYHVGRALSELCPTGILVVDLNGYVEEASPVAARYFGYHPNDMRGAHVQMFMPHITLDAADTSLYAGVTGDGTAEEMEDESSVYGTQATSLGGGLYGGTSGLGSSSRPSTSVRRRMGAQSAAMLQAHLRNEQLNLTSMSTLKMGQVCTVRARGREGTAVELKVMIKPVVVSVQTPRHFVIYCDNVNVQSQLRRSCDFFARIHDLLDIPLVRINREGRLAHVNASLYSELRYDRTQSPLEGRPFTTLFAPGQAARYQNDLQRRVAEFDAEMQAREGQRSRSASVSTTALVGIDLPREESNGGTAHTRLLTSGEILLQGQRGDGTRCQLRCRLAEVSSVRTGDISFIAYLRNCDHESRDRVADRLNESLVQTCPFAVLVVDGRGLVLKASTALAELCGYHSNQDLVYSHVAYVLQPAAPTAAVHGAEHTQRASHANGGGGDATAVSNVQTEEVMHCIRAALDTSPAHDGAMTPVPTLLARHRSGHLLPTTVTVRPVRREDASSLFVLAVQNLSEKYKSDATQRAIERMVTYLPIAVAVTNHEGVIEMANAALARVLGHGQITDLLGQNMAVLVAPADPTRDEDSLANYFKNYMMFAESKVVLRSTAAHNATGNSASAGHNLLTYVKRIEPASGNVEDARFIVYVTPSDTSDTTATHKLVGYTSNSGDVAVEDEFPCVVQGHRVRRLESWLEGEAGLPFIVLNARGRITHLSRGAAALFDVGRSELLQRPVTALLRPRPSTLVHHDGPGTRPSLSETTVTGMLVTMQQLPVGTQQRQLVVSQRSSGDLLPLELHWTKVYAGQDAAERGAAVAGTSSASSTVQGSASGAEGEEGDVYVVYLHDTRTMREATRMKELCDAALAHCAVPTLFVNSEDGTIQMFNEAAQTCFRCDAEAVLGAAVTVLLAPGEEGNAQVLRSLRDRHHTRDANDDNTSTSTTSDSAESEDDVASGVMERDLILQRGDGTRFPATLLIRAIKTGEVRFGVVHVIDRSDQTRTELVISLQKAVLSEADVSVIVVDAGGAALYATAQALQLLRYGVHERRLFMNNFQASELFAPPRARTVYAEYMDRLRGMYTIAGEADMVNVQFIEEVMHNVRAGLAGAMTTTATTLEDSSSDYHGAASSELRLHATAHTAQRPMSQSASGVHTSNAASSSSLMAASSRSLAARAGVPEPLVLPGTRVVGKDGAVVRVDVVVRPVVCGAALLGCVVQLTELSEGETSPYEVSEEHHMVIETAVEHYDKAFFLVNSHGELLLFSGAFSELLGYTSFRTALQALRYRPIGELLYELRPPNAMYDNSSPHSLQSGPHAETTIAVLRRFLTGTGGDALQQMAQPRPVTLQRVTGPSVTVFLMSFVELHAPATTSRKMGDEDSNKDDAAASQERRPLFAGTLVEGSDPVITHVPHLTQQLLESCPLPCAVTDRTGMIRLANAPLLQAFDYGPGALNGQSLALLLPALRQCVGNTESQSTSATVSHSSTPDQELNGGASDTAPTTMRAVAHKRLIGITRTNAHLALELTITEVPLPEETLFVAYLSVLQ